MYDDEIKDLDDPEVGIGGETEEEELDPDTGLPKPQKTVGEEEEEPEEEEDDTI